MDMAFALAKSGLFVPSPGGLPGFQRQRMDQTKKSAGAAFVLQNHYAPTASQAVTWAGAAVGDLAVAINNNSLTGTFTTPAGWSTPLRYTWTINGYSDCTAYKVLDATDILNGGATFSSLATDGTLSILVYRGASVATVVGAAGDVAANPAVGGFSKDPGSKGVIAYCATRGATTIISPAGATSRISNFAGTNFRVSVDEITYGGGPIAYGGGSTETIARAIELT